MNEVLHANIFFIIASIATVVFCILISIALYQLIAILRRVRVIVERIESASELVADDFAHVREFVKSGGLFARILGFMMGSPSNSRGKRRRTRTEDSED